MSLSLFSTARLYAASVFAYSRKISSLECVISFCFARTSVSFLSVSSDLSESAAFSEFIFSASALRTLICAVISFALTVFSAIRASAPAADSSSAFISSEAALYFSVAAESAFCAISAPFSSRAMSIRQSESSVFFASALFSASAFSLPISHRRFSVAAISSERRLRFSVHSSAFSPSRFASDESCESCETICSLASFNTSRFDTSICICVDSASRRVFIMALAPRAVFSCSVTAFIAFSFSAISFSVSALSFSSDVTSAPSLSICARRESICESVDTDPPV